MNNLKKKPLVAIVGRPNVGKSSLFNRMIGRRKAIVCDESGTTRDRVIGEVEWQGKYFTLVDTAGLFGGLEIKDMEAAIDRQIEMAVAGADVVLVVFDGKTAISNDDLRIINKLKRQMQKLVIVVNKMESAKGLENWGAFGRLSGVKKLAVSAKTGMGIGDLLEELIDRWPDSSLVTDNDEEVYRVSIVGRPNVGKSSLINKIAGQERMVVSQTPGTTRDIGEIKIKYGTENLIFFDTAGVRSRRVLSRNHIERFSYIRALKAMESSDVVVLMIDAEVGVGKTEVKLIDLVEDLGKGLVLFVNKMDLFGDGEEAVEKIMKDIRADLGYIDWVPVVIGSVQEDINLKPLLKNIIRVGENFQAEIKSKYLSDLVEKIRVNYRIPEVDLQRIKQISVGPPTFLVGNVKKHPSCQTRRMLVGIIRDAFQLAGVPIKLEFK